MIAMRRTAIEESNGEHALVSAATLQMLGLVLGMRVEIRALLTPPQADAEVKALASRRRSRNLE